MLRLVNAHYITSLQRDWPRVHLSCRHAAPAAAVFQKPPRPTSTDRFAFVCWCARLVVPALPVSLRRWPRARQTRRARRSSLRANISSTMECGCRPFAGGRWRRSPTSPLEVATYGSSPTRSQVNKPLRRYGALFQGGL